MYLNPETAKLFTWVRDLSFADLSNSDNKKDYDEITDDEHYRALFSRFISNINNRTDYTTA